MKHFLALFASVAMIVVGTSSAFSQNSNVFAAAATTTQKSSSALSMTVLTYKGKKKDFKAGSKLSAACAGLGVKPKYNCKKGECNSCVLTLAGSRVKPCVAVVPPEPRLKSLQEKGLEIR